MVTRQPVEPLQLRRGRTPSTRRPQERLHGGTGTSFAVTERLRHQDQPRCHDPGPIVYQFLEVRESGRPLGSLRRPPPSAVPDSVTSSAGSHPTLARGAPARYGGVWTRVSRSFTAVR